MTILCLAVEVHGNLPSAFSVRIEYVMVQQKGMVSKRGSAVDAIHTSTCDSPPIVHSYTLVSVLSNASSVCIASGMEWVLILLRSYICINSDLVVKILGYVANRRISIRLFAGYQDTSS